MAPEIQGYIPDQESIRNESAEEKMVRADAADAVEASISKLLMTMRSNGKDETAREVREFFGQSMYAGSPDMIMTGMEQNLPSAEALTVKDEIVMNAIDAMKRKEIDPHASNYEGQLADFVDRRTQEVYRAKHRVN